MAIVVKNPPVKAGRLKRHGFAPWVENTPRRRAWWPTAVFLPGETEEPGRLQSIEPHWSDTAHTHRPLCASSQPPHPRANSSRFYFLGHSQPYPQPSRHHLLIKTSIMTLRCQQTASFTTPPWHLFINGDIDWDPTNGQRSYQPIPIYFTQASGFFVSKALPHFLCLTLLLIYRSDQTKLPSSENLSQNLLSLI